MEHHNQENLLCAINNTEGTKRILEKINNESSLTILHYKTSLVMMIAACVFIINSLRIIERNLRSS